MMIFSNNKKAQMTGFNSILPIIVSIVMAGILIAILVGINDDLRQESFNDTGVNTSLVFNVTTKFGGAVSDFAGNFGTFFSLALVAIIILIIGMFIVKRRQTETF